MWINLYHFIYFSTIVFSIAYCETTTESTEKLLESYKSSINSSRDLDRSDRLLTRAWTSDFLLHLVNVTSHHRLDATRHKEHSFMGVHANAQLKECLRLHQFELSAADATHYGGETACVQGAHELVDAKKNYVSQIEKEIRKWRKSYRYLSNQCNIDNPGDEKAAGECLVEYIQKDNYHITFQRLVLLKLESMSDLYAQMTSSLGTLDTCLSRVVSRYLSDVRRVKDNLNHCYNIKTLSDYKYN